MGQLDDILKHQNVVRNNIMKSFGVKNSEDSLEKGFEDEINPFEMEAYKSELTKSELDEFEKAKHQDGDMHPNGKWVWRQSANGGKGDWRVAKSSHVGGSLKTTSSSTSSDSKTTNKEDDRNGENSWNKINEFATKTKKVFIMRNELNGYRYPVIEIGGKKAEVQRTIKEMNEYCGTNYSISDFTRKPADRFYDNSYISYVNTHNGKLYPNEKEAENNRPEAKDITSEYKKYKPDNYEEIDKELRKRLKIRILDKIKFAYKNKDVKLEVGTVNENGEIWMPSDNSSNRGWYGEWIPAEKMGISLKYS